MTTLATSIEFLKGVGPARAELLQKELQIRNFEDLLRLFPNRYVDRSRFYTIAELQSTQAEVQLLGKITHWEVLATKNRQKRLVAHFTDGTGTVELVWFKGVNHWQTKLQRNVNYVLYGRPSAYQRKLNFAHPDLETQAEFEASPIQGLQPIYPSTEKLAARGLNNRSLARLTRQLIPLVEHEIPEVLPSYLIEQLMPRRAAFRQIHYPQDLDHLAAARFRLKFEEILLLQLSYALQKHQHQELVRSYAFPEVGAIFNQFYHQVLPFSLTNAQKRVMKEIRQDLMQGYHMNRLVQGDVGSGKTIVALMAMLLAVDNGYQACLMAPTEILAQQHFQSLRELTAQLPVEVALLTGSTPAAARRQMHEALQAGTLHLLIGTHALIEPKVRFSNLGLAVVDEQHRFGVAQRAQLWQKNKLPPHILVMTATPIPRTLAMTVYGNLDISIIDELPPGRKPIETLWYFEKNRNKVFGALRREIARGRQVYIVFPLIEESEAMDYHNLMQGYESVVRAFSSPQYQISIVHGRMKPQDKDFEMQRFQKGETQIMVATTVIEVGVNVPNASVMVIESAERFGLSQLHQLRGRVGRGAEQSYCILMSGAKLSREARTRLQTMTETNDGFRIADVDMKLRGPGNLAGTQQSGLPQFQLANLNEDQELMSTCRQAAQALLHRDPRLEEPAHRPLRGPLRKLSGDKVDWGRIS